MQKQLQELSDTACTITSGEDQGIRFTSSLPYVTARIFAADWTALGKERTEMTLGTNSYGSISFPSPKGTTTFPADARNINLDQPVADEKPVFGGGVILMQTMILMARLLPVTCLLAES